MSLSVELFSKYFKKCMQKANYTLLAIKLSLVSYCIIPSANGWCSTKLLVQKPIAVKAISLKVVHKNLEE